MNSVPYLNRGPQSHETESPPGVRARGAAWPPGGSMAPGIRGEPPGKSSAVARAVHLAGVRKSGPPAAEGGAS